jgi:uncharacterized protein YqeY
MPTIAERMRADLVAALKGREPARASALRVALAALANAEAVDPTGPLVAAGLGGDVARRERDEAQAVAIVAAERDDLRDQAAALRARGRSEADDLDDRAAVLSAYLPATDEPTADATSHPA